MNNVRLYPSRALFLSVLMIAMFAAAAAAQKMPMPTLWEDTAINPHDFTDEYYESNGIFAKAIIGRRTGADLLSVISQSSNPIHTQVRVIVTFPAYGPSEEMLYWYPLGQVNNDGFTADKTGVIAREMAMATPLYVFPIKPDNGFTNFGDMRQAALFGPSETYYAERQTIKLVARRIVEVRYTAKAFDKESAEMMQYMLVKNGAGVDGLPIIRSTDDLATFLKYEIVATRAEMLWEEPSTRGAFAIAPVIANPTGGAIASDAFLLMPMLDGLPLPAEEIFATQFGCLKKFGDWCGK